MNNAESRDDLTPIQRKILEAIRKLTRERGRAPSYREVTDSIGRRSMGGLSYQYQQLIAKGYLRREPGRPPIPSTWESAGAGIGSITSLRALR
jgi:SOS-response transcriptional repressor LexA